MITRLICHFTLNIAAIEKELDIHFSEYFADELLALDQFVTDGLLSLSPTIIEVLPAGHLLIRNICMVFDRYIQQKTENNFSKVI